MLNTRPFGTLDGREVPLLTLSNAALSVELLPFGASIRSLRVPDRDGRPTDVCLGYDTLEEYRTQDACLGGTIGRCANRIGGARFTLDGREYRLTANEGENTLHGGAQGFHWKLWDWSCDQDRVVFTLNSPDGDEGFPGNLRAQVTYTLTGNGLDIGYQAVSDRDTVVSFTNHAYFNLAGHNGGPVADHVLTLRADRYTPANAANVPTGELTAVEGTPLDFRQGTALGERLDHPALAATRGLDHNFVLSGGAPAARLWCPRTGIVLEISASMPGMQAYTAGFLTPRPGKDGASYGPAHAVCLEPQHFPDAVNQPAFPSPILRAGETYRADIGLRFSVL